MITQVRHNCKTCPWAKRLLKRIFKHFCESGIGNAEMTSASNSFNRRAEAMKRHKTRSPSEVRRPYSQHDAILPVGNFLTSLSAYTWRL